MKKIPTLIINYKIVSCILAKTFLMKKLLLICVILFFGLQTFSFSPGNSGAISSYALPADLNVMALQEFLNLTPKRYQELTGKRMTFNQKIGFSILKAKLKKQLPDDKIKNVNNVGILSLLFGIVAIIGLIGTSVPVLGFISLFSAIAAVILGIKGLKRNKKDKNSLIGLILGGSYLLLAIIFIAFIINFGYK